MPSCMISPMIRTTRFRPQDTDAAQQTAEDPHNGRVAPRACAGCGSSTRAGLGA